MCGALAWLRPYAADGTAVAAMAGTDRVAVKQDSTTITLTPTGAGATGPTTGLIFAPGARVDARAYVPVLERVAAAGHPVVIVKQPFGLGFAALGAPSGIIDARPEVARWAVGGHSLGGVVAARAARDDQRIDGLVLWASYPDDAVSLPQLPAVSIYATLDGLATPDQIRAAATRLPKARFVAVDGAAHASFGDYGPQAGDGTPTISRDAAQAQIAAATTELLDALASS